MRASATRRATATLAVLAIASVAGCGDGGSSSPSEPAPAPPAPVAGPTAGIGGAGLNVLLISVDTTRADHLGCYGHPEVKTPNIDRFAAEGTRFAWCISSAPLTLPSHTTMLTGSYPFVHGARDNGVFFVDEGNVTLAEIFKDAGYATHAEVAAVVMNDRYGLDQGFDTYGDVEPRQAQLVLRRDAGADVPAPGEPAVESPLEPTLDLPEPATDTERRATEITDAGIEILGAKAAAGERFFVFLHYFDPHWPHEAPAPFVDQYEDGYYAEIAYFDAEFGRLMDALRELDLEEDTLVILTSDHGEGRAQHGEMTHSTFLYDTTLHVPLIIGCPGRIPAGQVVESQVRLLDLAPTIVDFARLEPTERMQGRTLLPLVADPELPVRLACYSDTLVPQNSLNYSPLRSLRTDDWKFILAPRNELYELEDDPLELFNVAPEKQQRVADMRQEMWDLIADSPSPPGRGSWRMPDPDEVRKLAALGYVSSSAFRNPDLVSGNELDHFEPSGPNPRDHIEVIQVWASGLGAYRMGKFEIAEKALRRFTELEPDLAFGPSYLGHTLMQLEQHDEAIEWFRRALELQPDNYLDHRSLGMLLLLRGELEEATESFRTALHYNPEDAASHVNLGFVVALRQQYEEALAIFDEAVANWPDDAPVYLYRGMVRRAMGRLEAAREDLDEALRLEPDLVRAREQLAVLRHQQGDTAEALEMLEETIAEYPDEPLLYRTLVDMRSALGDDGGAIEALRRFVELVPDDARGHRFLGARLVAEGRYDEGLEHLHRALELVPEAAPTLLALGDAQQQAGKRTEALRSYERLLEVAPKSALVYVQASDLLMQDDDPAAAIELLRKGREELPENVAILNELAWRLATVSDPALRDADEAVQLAEYVNAVKGGESSNELDTLAAAYAAAGRYGDAVAAAERALALARQGRQDDLADEIAQRLELFREGKPYRGL